MLGFGDSHSPSVDPTTLPIFVHALQNNEIFSLAQKVWQTNGRYLLADAVNKKELLRFVFSDPACVVWLERDQGRSDCFELILMWDAKGKQQDVTEVYVLNPQLPGVQPVGDPARVRDLLNTVLSSPATVPTQPA